MVKNWKIYWQKAQQVWEYLKTEEAHCVLSALPFFFNWLVFLTWFFRERNTVNISLYSGLNTCFFLVSLFVIFLIGFVPWIGLFLSNVLHLFLVLGHLGFSGFLIYATLKQKTIAIPFLHDRVEAFRLKIAPIAQLDRVSDYGSEG